MNEDRSNQYATGYAVYTQYEKALIDGILHLRPKATNGIKRTYALGPPDDDYILFSRIENENDLMAFTNEYGLLGKQQPILNEADGRDMATAAYPDKISESLKMAQEMRLLLKLWNQPEAANEILESLNSGTYKNYNYMENSIKPTIKGLIAGKHLDNSQIVKIFVAFTASSHINHIRASIAVTDKGDILQTFQYSSLRENLWHQFYLSLINKVTIKTCPECGLSHIGRGIFCPKPRFLRGTRNHSDCENRLNQRKRDKWPIVQDLITQGASIQEISERVNENELAITHWINQSQKKRIKEAPTHERQH